MQPDGTPFNTQVNVPCARIPENGDDEVTLPINSHRHRGGLCRSLHRLSLDDNSTTSLVNLFAQSEQNLSSLRGFLHRILARSPGSTLPTNDYSALSSSVPTKNVAPVADLTKTMQGVCGATRENIQRLADVNGALTRSSVFTHIKSIGQTRRHCWAPQTMKNKN